MLILQRKAGESLVIGEDITIRVVSVDGTRVRLAIAAPEDVPILRSELVIATAANRDSAMEEGTPADLLDLLGGGLDHRRGAPGVPPAKKPAQTPVPPEGKEDCPMMESIASMAMGMSAASFATNYSMAVTKKMMDTQELAGQELMKMLEAVPAPAKGQYIDVYA